MRYGFHRQLLCSDVVTARKNSTKTRSESFCIFEVHDKVRQMITHGSGCALVTLRWMTL